MTQFFDLTLNGISAGMIYAVVALGLVLIWRATRIVNFAQGAMAMFTTYMAVTLIDRKVDYWLAFVAALLIGLALGALVEVVLIRPLQGKPELNPVIVTLGLLILLEGVIGSTFGVQNRGFPAAFSQSGLSVGRTRISFSHFDVFILVAVLVLMGLMLVLFRATSIGLRMRAAAFNPESSRLAGVRVNRVLILGWSLAALAGSLAGLLVAPTAAFSPNYMDLILVYAFTAAVVGGLDSPIGGLVGGLLTGLALSYVGGYLGSSLEPLGAAAILIVVLAIRPEGLFSRPATRRV
jgi:branched-chain amino acid transport system permease protein